MRIEWDIMCYGEHGWRTPWGHDVNTHANWVSILKWFDQDDTGGAECSWGIQRHSCVPRPPANRSESASSLSLDGWCGEKEKERGGEGGNEAASSRSACWHIWFCGPASLCPRSGALSLMKAQDPQDPQPQGLLFPSPSPSSSCDCATEVAGSLLLNQRLNPGPWQWKCWVLTTEPPGSAQYFTFYLTLFGKI